MPSSAFPDSNQRLTVGLKPPGKASAQHAIESVVPSGFRPTRLQYVRKLIDSAGTVFNLKEFPVCLQRGFPYSP